MNEGMKGQCPGQKGWISQGVKPQGSWLWSLVYFYLYIAENCVHNCVHNSLCRIGKLVFPLNWIFDCIYINIWNNFLQIYMWEGLHWILDLDLVSRIDVEWPLSDPCPILRWWWWYWILWLVLFLPDFYWSLVWEMLHWCCFLLNGITIWIWWVHTAQI